MKITLPTPVFGQAFSNLKKLLVFLLVVLAFNSCKKDLLQGASGEELKAASGKVTLKKISYQNFLSKIGMVETGALGQLLTQTPDNNKQINGVSSHILSSFSVSADSVDILTVGDTLSYVLRLKHGVVKSAAFYNLTIEHYGDKVRAFVTTYKPNKNWIDQRRKGMLVPFTGKIGFSSVSLSGIANGAENSRVIQTVWECVTYTVYDMVGYPCVGEGAAQHYPGQWCSLFGEDGGPYVDFVASVRTDCSYTGGSGSPGNPGDGTGGGNNGGNTGNNNGNNNGNTTPIPPRDYRPCTAFSETGEEYVIPCEDGGGTEPLDPTGPDPAYDPYIDQMQISRSETVFDSETGQFYTYGQIEDFHLANPDAIEELRSGTTFPPSYPGWMYANASNMLNEIEYLSMVHPNWGVLKISTVATWNVMKGNIHFALDIAGLVPAFGEAADIINGAIYYLEGDRINAAMSLAAAIPVYGWVSTGGKWIRTAGKSMARPLNDAAGKIAYVAFKNSKGAVRFIKVALTSFSHGAVTALKAVKPADNTLTNLSRTMIDQLSLRIKPTAQSLKNKIDDIVQNGDALGTKTETLCDDLFATNGFVKHEAKIGSNNGFDGVYIKKDASGNVQEVIINEAKQVGNAGNIKLNAGNPGTGLNAQMSDAWISNIISQLKNNTNTSALGNTLEPLFQNNRNLFTKTVTGVDKASGDIVVLKLAQY